jgi:hypothetical protein
MKVGLILATAASVLALAGSASATVTYDFSGNFNSSNFNPDNAFFKVTTSSFIDSKQDFTAADSGLKCVGVFTQCTGVSFLFDVNTGQDTVAINYQDFNGGQSGSVFYNFVDGAFGKSGKYSQDEGAFFNNGTLTVSVPEPSVWAMMLAGFAVLGGALRFRRSQALGAAV